MNEIKAIIFDMGGVIIRTCDRNPRQELANRLGIPISELENKVFYSDSSFRLERGEITKQAHWKNVLHNINVKNANIKEIDEAFWAGDRLNSELVEFIRKLKKNYRIGLLSNAFLNAREWLDKKFHFINEFDLSVFSYEVEMRKPDSRIYLLICNRLRVNPSSAVFIDDFFANVQGARNAGLQAIQYKENNQIRNDLNALLQKRK